MGQIKVNFDVLAEQERTLGVLASRVQNRNLELTFNRSEGAYVAEMQEQARILKQLGADLAVLISSTQAAVQRTRTAFQDADNTVAAAFGCAGN